MLAFTAVLTVADIAVAGWLLLSVRTARRPDRLRVTGLLLLLCAAFLLYVQTRQHGPELAPREVVPTSTVDGPPANV